ncbi:UNVERIFIED_CONTAM: hypothetical protein Sindi_2965700, partial [Sesamum indicum]
LLRPSGPTRGSTGIFTCCPSTTPFGLILGPDSPSVDEPCGGTLRFSGHWILTNVCVTQADILASASSTAARAGLPSKAERSPTDVFLHPTASADRLAPFIFGARALDQVAALRSLIERCAKMNGAKRSAKLGKPRASSGGRSGSENVGLSNANIGENPMPRKPKGSSARFVHGG